MDDNMYRMVKVTNHDNMIAYKSFSLQKSLKIRYLTLTDFQNFAPFWGLVSPIGLPLM